MKIYPYMNGSKSVRALADALGCKVLKREGKDIRVDCIINWGASAFHRNVFVGQDGSGELNILNYPEDVLVASNKLLTFKEFFENNVPTVQWTENFDEAEDWLIQGEKVVERHSLTGHSGNGIKIKTYDDGLEPAPLYTKYTPKKDEYRIHVFNGIIIFQQRKARKKDVPDEQVNWQVRNHANGFIFANDNIVAPEDARSAAILAVAALSLDFGAVDIGVSKDGTAVVYEVNTAPGLTGKTLDAYVEAFRDL